MNAQPLGGVVLSTDRINPAYILALFLWSQLSAAGRIDPAYNLALVANRKAVDALLALPVVPLLEPTEEERRARLLAIARTLPISDDARDLVTPNVRGLSLSDRRAFERFGSRSCEELALYLVLVARDDAELLQAERELRERTAVVAQQRTSFNNLRGLLKLPPAPPAEPTAKPNE